MVFEDELTCKPWSLFEVGVAVGADEDVLEPMRSSRVGPSLSSMIVVVVLDRR